MQADWLLWGRVGSRLRTDCNIEIRMPTWPGPIDMTPATHQHGPLFKQMGGWVSRWMDGWPDGWMAGWMARWLDEAARA